MARYTGPKSKISRKFGEAVLGPSKALAKKAYPPGQHGRGRRGKKSDYALQLLEKQKIKYTYGVLERQFARIFHLAGVKEGQTGENLIKLCESRLDNIVYRLGIAPTRRAARQLVTHKHILLDGEVSNIPSILVKPGQKVAVREKSKALDTITTATSLNAAKKYGWLEFDNAELTGLFINYPDLEQIPEQFNVQAVVELYNK
ncbi:30S ribosomal protein S4 [Leadbetterella byssophila]|jgi:small subunit ribosomal protein S4|uniref:Small ribosomal subunit protein uS4 n=1 Tax=Leadbetterella byssophila (strain DSM 17132 / JCM 16389 / KACC 11308 / NBRC 106382 / 4M15) TaxID=649349 RepID=E4RQQ4_LEAB4|nr:30S ribosomal protein S4 [Leadbetterella byssophila]ADQ17510.1 SSU ribosomal protein S4P [Leadbetterella byssophila DSM 17132]